MSDNWDESVDYMPEYLSAGHWRSAKALAESGDSWGVRYWMCITDGTGLDPEEQWRAEQSPLARAIEKIAAETDWQGNGPSRDSYYATKYLKEQRHMEHQLRRFLPADEAT